MSRTVSLYKFDEDYAHDLKLYEYIDKDYYVIKEFMPTEYGTVVYMILSGGPHGSDPMLKFVDTSGNEYNFYNLVPRLTPWIHPECNDLKLSEDNKILTYSVSLREHVIINITEYNILHEAGTYYFMANLETKQYERIAFEPIKK
jgi:hypothetical protein